ncbi:MAG: class I SAM-dependent methyltransferase [Selenomonas ruminantium]|nr:class I SAM-dependent methyltransferase [Selenomonas ruminantium]
MLKHIASKAYGEAMRKYALPGKAGLELGPLYHPFVTKAEGRQVSYIDYQSAEELREANKDNPEIDVRDIVDIDYVWTPGKGLLECLQSQPESEEEAEQPAVVPAFDYIVASQVIEHVPDTLGWVKELFSVLKVGGTLVLGFPDKRYTFDAYRRDTTLPEVIEAYCRREKLPTPRQIFDNCAYAVEDRDFEGMVDMSVPFSEREKKYSPQEALNFATYAYFNRKYIDSHCTVWTPDNFREIFGALAELGLLQCSFELVEIPEAASFVVFLTKEGVGRDLPESYEERLEKENAHLHKAYDEAVALQQELWGRLDKAGLLQESEQ